MVLSIQTVSLMVPDSCHAPIGGGRQTGMDGITVHKTVHEWVSHTRVLMLTMLVHTDTHPQTHTQTHTHQLTHTDVLL